MDVWRTVGWLGEQDNAKLIKNAHSEHANFLVSDASEFKSNFIMHKYKMTLYFMNNPAVKENCICVVIEV